MNDLNICRNTRDTYSKEEKLDFFAEALFSIASIFAGSRPPELFCPFATPAHPTPVTWRIARFTCPRGTTKVLAAFADFVSDKKRWKTYIA